MTKVSQDYETEVGIDKGLAGLYNTYKTYLISRKKERGDVRDLCLCGKESRLIR